MTSNSCPTDCAREASLARLVESLTARLHAGEPLDLPALQALHPEHAGALAELWPALHALAELERSSRPADSPATADEPGPSGMLGDFRIVREVGRGGMGIVYEAEQLSLGRRVALKVLPFAGTMDPRRLQRFQNEARAAASLQHPHIVPVHAVGCERGVYYYAMQFIDGQPLDKLLQALRKQQPGSVPGAGDTTVDAGTQDRDDDPTQKTDQRPRADNIVVDGGARASTVLSEQGANYFRRVAELGIQAAEALEHAHSCGIIHRDIKPANLMVDGRGQLWVADFGLARMTADSDLTVTGGVVGTLRYMSPEQALARHGLFDHRSDIYSLGATLYELATLRPAVGGEDRQEILRRIASEEPSPPRHLRASIPSDMETILVKCLEKSPHDRYATAHDLACDLVRFLKGEPILARPVTRVGRLTKWARRNPSATVSIALGIVVIVLATVSSAMAVLWREAARAHGEAVELHEIAEERRLEAETAHSEADRLRARAERYLFGSQMNEARLAWQESRLDRFRAILEQQLPERTGKADLRGFEWHYLWRLANSELVILAGGLNVGFSGDGNRAVIPFSGGQLRPKVLEIQTGQEIPLGEADVSVSKDDVVRVRYRLNENGTRLARLRGGELTVWDLPKRERILQSRPTKKWQFMSGGFAGFLEGGKRIAWTHEPKALKVRVLGEEDEVTIHFDSEPAAIAFSADSSRLAYRVSKRVAVVDGASGRETSIIPDSDAASLALSRTGKYLAVGHTGGFITVYDTDTARQVQVLHGHTGGVSMIRFAHDDRRIAAIAADGTVRGWDTGTGTTVIAYRTHCQEFTDLSFSADGNRLLCAAYDPTTRNHTIRVWDAHLPLEALTIPAHSSPVTSLAFSPDGTRVASASWQGLPAIADGTVKIWDSSTWQPICSMTGHRKAVPTVAFSPCGKHIATGGMDGTIRIWDAAEGKEIRNLHSEQHEIKGLAFSPDGKWLASGSHRALQLWKTEGWRIVASFREFQGHVCGVAFSPDSRLVAGGSLGGPSHATLRIYNTASLQEIRALAPGAVSSLAFSPDGKRLAVGTFNRDYLASVWEVDTGKEVLMLKGHSDRIGCVKFSPDGRRIVTGGEAFDRAVKVWDATTGQELLTLRGHHGRVNAVAFSPDGMRVVSGSEDKTIKVWDANPVGTKRLPQR